MGDRTTITDLSIYNILHRLQVYHLTLTFIIHNKYISTLHLYDDNRGVRKRALSKLCKEVGGHKDNLKFLLKPVLKMLSDPVENCRAVSIELFMEYVTVYV